MVQPRLARLLRSRHLLLLLEAHVAFRDLACRSPALAALSPTTSCVERTPESGGHGGTYASQTSAQARCTLPSRTPQTQTEVFEVYPATEKVGGG